MNKFKEKSDLKFTYKINDYSYILFLNVNVNFFWKKIVKSLNIKNRNYENLINFASECS